MKKLILGMLFLSILVMADAKILIWKCKFQKYSTTDGLKKTKNFNLTFRLDIISNKSFMEGNNGLVDVASIYNETENSVTFLEVTKGQNVMITTITEDGKAVHSRNTVMLKTLVPSQYYGTCGVSSK